MNMAESSPEGWKTLWEKEKLLVTSNFSFFYSVFKRHVLLKLKNQIFFYVIKADTENYVEEKGHILATKVDR